MHVREMRDHFNVNQTPENGTLTNSLDNIFKGEDLEASSDESGQDLDLTIIRKDLKYDPDAALKKYLHIYWRNNVIDKKLSVSEIDHKVHILIHKLIRLAADDSASSNEIFLNKNMVHHQRQIQAVKNAIKPGLYASLFTPFTKEMV